MFDVSSGVPETMLSHVIGITENRYNNPVPYSKREIRYFEKMIGKSRKKFNAKTCDGLPDCVKLKKDQAAKK